MPFVLHGASHKLFTEAKKEQVPLYIPRDGGKKWELPQPVSRGASLVRTIPTILRERPNQGSRLHCTGSPLSQERINPENKGGGHVSVWTPPCLYQTACLRVPQGFYRKAGNLPTTVKI